MMQFYQQNIPDPSKQKKKKYWTYAIIGFVGYLILMSISISAPGATGDYESDGAGTYYVCENGERVYSSFVENDGIEDCMDGSDEPDADYELFSVCAGLSCCLSIIFGISALTVKPSQRVMIIQNPQPMVVPQQITIQNQIPVQQTQPQLQQPQQQAISRPSVKEEQNSVDWVAKAKNLEMARNWDEAARAYEKAGLYAEAGRIRQEHMEKNQPMVQIGQVGNTVLNDSVMIAEGGKKSCTKCGNQCELEWSICPNCSNPL